MSAVATPEGLILKSPVLRPPALLFLCNPGSRFFLSLYSATHSKHEGCFRSFLLRGVTATDYGSQCGPESFKLQQSRAEAPKHVSSHERAHGKNQVTGKTRCFSSGPQKIKLSMQERQITDITWATKGISESLPEIDVFVRALKNLQTTQKKRVQSMISRCCSVERS